MQGIWKENINGWNHKNEKRKKQTRKHTLKDKVKPLIKKFYYKNIDNDVIKNEANQYEIIKKSSIFKYSGFIDIWKIEIYQYLFDNISINQLKHYTFKVIHKVKNYWIDTYKRFIFFHNDLKNYLSKSDLKKINKNKITTLYISFKISSFKKEAYFLNKNWYDIYNHSLISKDSDISMKKLSLLETKEIIYHQPIEIKNQNSYFYKPFQSQIFIYNKPLKEKWNHIYGFWCKRSRKFFQIKANRKDRRLVKKFIKNEDWDNIIKTHYSSKSIEWEVW